eukprot:RCo035070
MPGVSQLFIFPGHAELQQTFIDELTRYLCQSKSLSPAPARFQLRCEVYQHELGKGGSEESPAESLSSRRLYRLFFGQSSTSASPAAAAAAGADESGVADPDRVYVVDSGSSGDLAILAEHSLSSIDPATGLGFLLHTLRAFQRLKFTVTVEGQAFVDSDWAVRVGQLSLLKRWRADVLEVEYRPLHRCSNEICPALSEAWLVDFPAGLPRPVAIVPSGGGSFHPTPALYRAACYVTLLKGHILGPGRDPGGGVGNPARTP